MAKNYVQELKELAELKNSGSISDEEYETLKKRILDDSEEYRSALVPLTTNENLDPKYAEEFSEEGFWDKITSVFKKAGSEIIYKALQLFYATQNPECPMAIKAAIYAALGYFILPLDLIPDVIPVVGFSDDLLAIGAAIAMAHVYIDDKVIYNAKEKMCSLFGNDIIDKLN